MTHTGETIARELGEGWRASGWAFACRDVAKGLHVVVFDKLDDQEPGIFTYVKPYGMCPKASGGTPAEALTNLADELRALRDRINATLAALEAKP
jgi:hypothetical protein